MIMETKAYHLSPTFTEVLTEEQVYIGLVLRDQPSPTAQQLAKQFNDLYHLFLHKFSRLNYDPYLSHSEEQEMKCLLDQILQVKRALEALDGKF